MGSSKALRCPSRKGTLVQPGTGRADAPPKRTYGRLPPGRSGTSAIRGPAALDKSLELRASRSQEYTKDRAKPKREKKVRDKKTDVNRLPSK